jgi:hypothetical protein
VAYFSKTSSFWGYFAIKLCAKIVVLVLKDSKNRLRDKDFSGLVFDF